MGAALCRLFGNMKRLRNISDRVKLQIVADYKEKVNGSYRYTLRQIADKHEVSLSSVNNLAKLAHCQCRPQGGKKNYTPSARDLKVLRDLTLPGITYAEVGRMNPHQVIDKATGKLVTKPLTKARVGQIVETWRKRGMPKVRSQGFKRGQRIEWAGQYFTVLRYDNSHQGAAKAEANGEIYDPFVWMFKGKRSRVVDEAGVPVET